MPSGTIEHTYFMPFLSRSLQHRALPVRSISQRQTAAPSNGWRRHTLTAEGSQGPISVCHAFEIILSLARSPLYSSSTVRKEFLAIVMIISLQINYQKYDLYIKCNIDLREENIFRRCPRQSYLVKTS